MYERKNHRKTDLKVHMIFVTKYRKKLLVGTMGACVEDAIAASCKRHGYVIVKMETDVDHIHMLIRYGATEAVCNMARNLKRESTYILWQGFRPALRRAYWKERTFWSDGYFASSICQASQATIEAYIENQG